MRHATPIPDRRLIEFCIAQIDGAIARPSAFALRVDDEVESALTGGSVRDRLLPVLSDTVKEGLVEVITPARIGGCGHAGKHSVVSCRYDRRW